MVYKLTGHLGRSPGLAHVCPVGQAGTVAVDVSMKLGLALIV